MLPYEIVGNPRTRALTAESFQPGQQTLGIMSTVAKLEVPRNIAMVLRRGAPLQAYIKAVYETQGALTLVGGNVQIDLGAQGIRLVQSQRNNPAFPTSAHQDIAGFLSDDNGATWQETNVLSVNWQTGVVVLQGNIVPAANKARVLYLPGDGELPARRRRAANCRRGAQRLRWQQCGLFQHQPALAALRRPDQPAHRPHPGHRQGRLPGPGVHPDHPGALQQPHLLGSRRRKHLQPAGD